MGFVLRSKFGSPVQHPPRRLANLIRTRTRSAIFVSVFIILFFTRLHFHRLHWGANGRWVWNYAISYHPVLAHILPKGDWNPIENPPRYVPGIVEAPWMGDWGIPHLSKPVHNPPTSRQHRHLISPALIKIHIFSAAREKYRGKRKLIRELSPVFNMPENLQHLVDVKFIVGRNPEEDSYIDREMEEFGDILRLEELWGGENLREGKILKWINATVNVGRDAFWMFKVDDDAVFNLPNLLDVLVKFDPHEPHYVGTSLNRWPSYHYHFTGAVAGFNYGVAKSLAWGINTMSKQDLEAAWDDDVLVGELMFTLPSGPQCRRIRPDDRLPKYCDPNEPPEWGYDSPPPSPDPRTGLQRHDLLERIGDWYIPWVKGDIGFHGCKDEYGYRDQWEKRVRGHIWEPPVWMDALAAREK